ncbi:MAG: hypothetical protein HC859_05790 [Bacteroidia bacterium]|nr:hypothetical protein [Bacteroidia bacterium]
MPIKRAYHFFDVKGETYCWTDAGYMKFNLKERKVTKADIDFEGAPLLYDEDEDILWTRDALGGYLFKDKWENDKLTRDTVLHDLGVYEVLTDAEGNTWFATNGGGLFKYFIQDFDRCSSDAMRSVMAIMKDRNDYSWIGTMNKGLWRMKKGKIDHFYDPEEVYRNRVQAIAEATDGTVWAGSSAGLGRYNPETNSFDWLTYRDGLAANGIFNISPDTKGGIWVGTGGGVSYFDGDKFTNYTTENGLASNLVWSTHYHKDTETLYVANDYGLNTIHDGKVESLTIPDLDKVYVMSISTFRDSLLVMGTGGMGVLLYNPKSGDRKLVTTHEGLTSGFVYFVGYDQDDYLWIGSEKGISRLQFDNAFNIVTNLHYDYDNGLTGIETNQNAFYLGADKKFFGLIDGLYQYNNINRQNQRSFDLHLTDLQILYGEYQVRAYADSLFGFFKLPYRPSFPPDKNHLTFQFNRVDKRYPKSIRFRYMLENFDKTWSQPSASGQVTYSNLPPGEYIFRVMATNNQGSWSDSRIAYPFTIQRPFYLTTSFVVGMIILFAGSITLLLYIRVRHRVNKMLELERIRHREQESLRKEIARDFHDEMGNQLTRIINYVSLLKLNGAGSGTGSGHSDLYTKVESSAKYLYSGTRDFIWSIDPVNDELGKLFLHIRDFGEKLFEEKSINFRAFNEVRERIRLPYGFSREANLIFKEAMTNAFKYSNAKNVTLQLTRDEAGYILLSFEDDGIGFLTNEPQKSNGLKNIRERAERIRSVLRINSIKDRGTRIVLQFKLTKTHKYGIAF